MSFELYRTAVQDGLNEWAKKELIQKGLKFNNELNLFLQYQYHLRRLISQRPRKITISSEFVVPDHLKNEFELLKQSIEMGEDLEPYLTRTIDNVTQVDNLQDIFGLTHLHFVKVGAGDHSEIAIVHVSSDEIFFIEVKLHGRKVKIAPWFEKSSLEIVDRERPDLIKHLKFPSHSVSQHSKGLDYIDIKNLRKQGYSFSVKLDNGSEYAMPYSGQVTAAPKTKIDKKYRTFSAEDHTLFMILTQRTANDINKWIQAHFGCSTIDIVSLKIVNLEMVDNRNVKKFDLFLKFLFCGSLHIMSQPFVDPRFNP